MVWTDKFKETAKEFLSSDLGQDVKRMAREKIERGLDKVLGGHPEEGERMIDEAKEEVKSASPTGQQGGDTPAGESPADLGAGQGESGEPPRTGGQQ